MDAQGVIVASGDRDRIGQVHAGALLVLSRGRSVEIDETLAGQLEGVRPGVNLVLRAEGRIVGCVGLSGAPDTIRVYAELVRLAAESMLEQSQLQRRLARDARQKEELTLALARAETLSPEIVSWAEKLGVDPRLPRVAAVIEVEGGVLEPEAVLGELQRLHALLSTSERDSLAATLSLNEMVVLKPALNRKGDWDPAAHRRQAEALLARMRESSPLPVRFALGRYFPEAGGLARSFEIARATLKAGKASQPDGVLFVFEDRVLAVLLDGLGEGWQGAELGRPLARLAAQDRRGQLRATLAAWYANGMRLGATARALAIHRNTLDYRMRRIEEICAVDFQRSEDCVRLYLALNMRGRDEGAPAAHADDGA
jgi:carbohydrate diacid regulator